MWQDISTAPKDGTVFLAFDDDNGSFVSVGVVAAHWDDGDGEYEPEWIVSEIGTGDSLNGCNLTHWMPLPKPPVKASK
jgi:Protein of unknown function (DUF551)